MVKNGVEGKILGVCPEHQELFQELIGAPDQPSRLKIIDEVLQEDDEAAFNIKTYMSNRKFGKGYLSGFTIE